MPPASLDELINRIQRDFDRLSPQFQIAARYLLDFPAEVPVASMRSISREAGVQPATLVRLAKSLDFKGWDELKRLFVQSLRQSPLRYTDQARRLLRDKHQPEALGRATAMQAENIRLLERLNADRLPAAIRLLARAQHVYVAGFRASFASAYTLHYLYRLFRPSVSLLRGDAGGLEMELRAVSKRDTVVVTSFSPYSHESIRVSQAAKQAGAKVVAICDSIVAPVALKADTVLVFSTATPSFFPSSAAAVALVEILVEQLLAKAGKQAIADLERAETQLHQTGAYV